MNDKNLFLGGTVFGVRKGLRALGVLAGLLAVSVNVEAKTLKVCSVPTKNCPYASVQDAVDAAGNGDTIHVGTGVFTGPISFQQGKDLKVVGQGRTQTVLAVGAIPADRAAISCSSGGSVVMRNLAISGKTGLGRVIDNRACQLTIANSTIQKSVGGVFNITNAGSMTVTDSDIHNNQADSCAGFQNGGTLIIKSSRITNNLATWGIGGGICNGGTLTLNNSSVSNNEAASMGGGISNGGTLYVKSSAVHNNHAYSNGGGIYNSGTVVLTSSLIDYNNAQGQGGGIFNHASGVIENDGNTLIMNNTPNDCADTTGTVSCP